MSTDNPRLPLPLKKLLDEKGFLTVKQFAKLLGIKYARALAMIPDRLDALDLREPSSNRPCYRILEQHIVAFYERHQTRQNPTDKRPRKKRRKKSSRRLLDEK